MADRMGDGAMNCPGRAHPELLVAILAGGVGSRIGGGKPERMLGGVSLIERAAEAAQRWTSDIVIAGRLPGQAPADARMIADAPGAEGPIAGLAAALDHARRERHALLLTIPCDTPFLPADLADRLRNALAPELGASVAASGGVLHPSCALWRARSFDRLGPFLAAGRSSLRGFASEIGFSQVDWPTDPIDPFFNINSAADLAAAEEVIQA